MPSRNMFELGEREREKKYLREFLREATEATNEAGYCVPQFYPLTDKSKTVETQHYEQGQLIPFYKYIQDLQNNHRQPRVLITGSRGWSDYAFIDNCLRHVGMIAEFAQMKFSMGFSKHPVLISGACPQGADMMCEMVAKELGWPIEPHPAVWYPQGPDGPRDRLAGFSRNIEMVESRPDITLAFNLDESSGTSQCVAESIQQGIYTVCYAVSEPTEDPMF